MQTLVLSPVSRARGTIVLPGSKSISNRTLLLANFLALTAILMLNVPFLRLIRTHNGVKVGGLSCGLLIIELLAAGAGSAFGIATYLGGKKY